MNAYEYRRNIIAIDGVKQVNVPFKRAPVQIIDITNVTPFSSVISLDKQLEKQDQLLLNVAFQGNFNPQKILKADPRMLRTQFKKASECLTTAVKNWLPNTFQYTFDISCRDSKSLQVNIIDQFEAETDFSLRGAGVQRMMSIASALAGQLLGDKYFYILCDEPENSLHPHAQRSVRSMFEELGSRQNVQVIYTTHSPSMINNFCPLSLRMVRRKKDKIDNKSIVIAEIDNSPIEKNFQNIRDALGIRPSDTLLYAPVVVIVEGKTEMVCLPYLIKRLHDSSVTEFNDILSILDNVSFLDASKIGYWAVCKVIKGYKSIPILFLDEDQKKSLDKGKKAWKEEGEDVEKIFSKKGEEFEDIVPKKYYFEAINTRVDKSSLIEISDDAINQWWTKEKSKKSGFKEQLFSKKVLGWLKKNDIKILKSEVMHLALEKTPDEEINFELINELLAKIRNALKKRGLIRKGG